MKRHIEVGPEGLEHDGKVIPKVPAVSAAKTIAREAAIDWETNHRGRLHGDQLWQVIEKHITRALSLSEQQEDTKDKGRCSKCGKERVLHFPSDHPFASAALSESGAHKEKRNETVESKLCPHCGKGKIFPDTHYCGLCEKIVYYEKIALSTGREWDTLYPNGEKESHIPTKIF